MLSVEELRACGLTDRAVIVRAHNGRLHRIHNGVYAVGHPNLTRNGRFLAAVKACRPTAVLSHFSAAAFWGFVEWDERVPEVTVVGTATRLHAGIRVHRTRRLERVDYVHRDGIPLTGPPRTLVDLAGSLSALDLRQAMRRAQGLRLVNERAILAALTRAGKRAGARALRALLAASPAPTRTVLEDVVLDLILRGGLAHPDVNKPLWIGRRRVIPDFRWPDQRLVVEADGAAWHDNPLARADDAERQALLEAHGERVVRVTWEQAVAHPRQSLERMAAAGAPGA